MLRWLIRPARRPPSARSIGGAYPLSDVSTSPATACCDSFSPSIWARIDANRSAASSIPTGRSANIADTRLLYVPRSPWLRTDTGTIVRTVRPLTSSPPRVARPPLRLGVGVEDPREQVGAGDPVDHAVVRLRGEGEVAVLETLDHPHLPERARPVELLRHDPADEVPQLLGATRRRQ